MIPQLTLNVTPAPQVGWAQYRFEEIQEAMMPFLQAAGFPPAKTTFIPLAAMEGINLVQRDCPELQEWYDGPTLMELLGKCYLWELATDGCISLHVPPQTRWKCQNVPWKRLFVSRCPTFSKVRQPSRLV
jgi:translation elongation factor EF-1alpha